MVRAWSPADRPTLSEAAHRQIATSTASLIASITFCRPDIAPAEHPHRSPAAFWIPRGSRRLAGRRPTRKPPQWRRSRLGGVVKPGMCGYTEGIHTLERSRAGPPHPVAPPARTVSGSVGNPLGRAVWARWSTPPRTTGSVGMPGWGFGAPGCRGGTCPPTPATGSIPPPLPPWARSGRGGRPVGGREGRTGPARRGGSTPALSGSLPLLPAHRAALR